AGKPQRGIGCHPGKSIAAATLHPDYQVRSRASLAPAPVENLQVLLGRSNDRADHGVEADMRRILQCYEIVIAQIQPRRELACCRLGLDPPGAASRSQG